MRKAVIPTLLLLPLLLLQAPAPSDLPTMHGSESLGLAAGGAWEISDHEVCDEPERTVATDITVLAGGVLDLQGCMFVMDVPPYEQRTFDFGQGAMTVRIEEGGELRMEALPDRPAGFRALNASNRYVIENQGLVVSEGLPETRNEVRDLRGRHQGQLVLGGFQSSGEMRLSHTWLYANAGPSVFLGSGGTLKADNLTVQGLGSITGMSAGSVDIVDLHIESVYSAVAFTQSDDVSIRRCDLSGITNAVISFGTHMRLQDCRITARNPVALERAADVELADATLVYNTTGVLSRPDHKMDDASRANNVSLERVTLEPTGDEAEEGIRAFFGDVRVRNSTFQGDHTGPAVNATHASVDIQGSRFLDGSGATAIRLRDPHAAVVVDNSFAGEAIAVDRSLRVMVLDSQGRPVNGSHVELDGLAEAQTGADGWTELHWRWLETGSIAALEWPGSMVLRADDPESGEVYAQTVSGDAGTAQIRFGQSSSDSWKPVVVFLGIVAAGGVGGVAWTFVQRRISRA